MVDGGATPVDFFISYTQADERWAEWIRLELEQAGCSALAQMHDFAPGTSWVREMDEALQRARRTIGVLSPAYLKSDPATAERDTILAEDPRGRQRRFVPVRVAPVRPKGLLGAIAYIDLVGASEGEARHRLLSGLELPVPNRDPSRELSRIPYPGDLLATRWHVPHHLNHNFVDRDDLVDRLHEELSAPDAVHCALWGMGGVGKTQVAASYVFRHGDQYDAVWWISAADLSSLRRDYAELAMTLGVEERGIDDPDELMEAVRSRIEQGSKRWLLILDDSSGPDSTLEIMPGRNAKVIVTSRNRQWRQRHPNIEVEVFSDDVSVQFLLDRSCDTDAEAARDLGDELGRLPLALEQAGAFIARNNHHNLAGYLRLFRSPAAESLLSQSDTPETRSVAATFLPAFQEMQAHAPDAAAMLCLVAFLAPDDIPIGLLLEARRAVPDLLGDLPADEMALGNAISRLNEYSLLRGQVLNSLAVHQLVQKVLRAHLRDARRQWAGAAVRLLAGEFPTQRRDRTAWPLCARLLPHVEAATGFAEAEGAAPEATIQLLTSAGNYLRHRYDFVNAREVSVRAVHLAEVTYQPALSTFATTLEQLSIVFCHERNLDEARIHLERALMVGQAAWGENDDRVGRLLERLAFEVLRPQEEFVEARAMLERAARIYEQRHGPRHVWIAYASAKLGFVLWDLQEDLPAARAAFERAQDIFEGADGFGPDHPALAFALTGLGQVLVDQRRLANARRCQERALAIFEKAFGDGDLDVARTLDKLGYVAREQRRRKEAKQLHLRSLQIFRSVYPEDNHPDAAFALTNLAMVLGELGELEEARQHHERALAVFERFGDARFAGVARGRLADLSAENAG